MKLPTVLLALSVAANAALLTAFAVRPTLAPPQVRSFFTSEAAPAPVAKTAVQTSSAAATTAVEAGRPKPGVAATEQQPTLWSKLQTDDLRTLVQRLKAAGFPVSVVRAVVSAELQKRYAPRLNAVMASPAATEYWKGELNSYSSINSKVSEERNKIYRERSRVMREVLGDDFFGSDVAEVSETMRNRFGNLSRAKIDLVQRISEDYEEMTNDIRSAARGVVLPEDRAKLALLEREKRADLAAVLTPQELQEYEMRTSMITSRLRQSMTLMDATEQEFRTIYSIHQKYADQLDPTGGLGGSYTSNTLEKRHQAEKQVQLEIAAALGEARAAEFERSSNYEYRQLAAIAKQNNLATDAAVRAYELRAAAAEQSVRIGDDRNMTPEQKRAALQALAQETREKLTNTLGPAGQDYAKSASWLSAIERGSTVRFMGSTTSFRSIPSVTPRN